MQFQKSNDAPSLKFKTSISSWSESSASSKPWTAALILVWWCLAPALVEAASGMAAAVEATLPARLVLPPPTPPPFRSSDVVVAPAVLFDTAVTVDGGR